MAEDAAQETCSPNRLQEAVLEALGGKYFATVGCHCAELRSFRRGWMALRFREDNV